MQSVRQQFEIPVAYHFQVVVAGGGPAGVMAAIASARSGAKTLLIERANCAGGIWTSGMLSWMLDVANKDGIVRELMDRLEAQNEGYYGRGSGFIAFPEAVKRELDSMLAQAGVHVFYYTQFVDALVEGNRITHAIIESKAGRQAVEGEIFIDATGDGDLAARAGCQFQIGMPDNGQTQPSSLIGIMTGVHAASSRPFNNTLPYQEDRSAKERLLQEMKRAGITPSYRAPSFFHIADDIWLVMTTHGYQTNALDPCSLTQTTIDCRNELHAQEKALRALGAPWNNLRIIDTAPYLGVRECRRILGKYTVTLQDALNGVTHPDAVCRVCFSLDIHQLHPENDFAAQCEPPRCKPYDIPLRALESADRENLLLAGRLISGDFYAHSSYRVTGDAATLGEAAGRAAAKRVKKAAIPT